MAQPPIKKEALDNVTDFGTTPRRVVVTDANTPGRLGAVDARNVLNLNASQLFTGIVPNGRLSGSVGFYTNLDADTLDGQEGTYYLDSNNMTGIIPVARLSGTYNINISGDANTLDGQDGDFYESYDIAAHNPGLISTAPTEIARVVATRKFRIPTNFGNAKARAGAAGSITFSIRKNGTPIGTCTFTGSTVGVFGAAAQTDFNPAVPDVLTVVATGTSGSLSDIGITLEARIIP